MRYRQTIELTLGPDEALERVEASFNSAPVSTVPRWWDRGRWQTERTERGLLVVPGSKSMLFEPPVDDAQGIPEHLAISVEATALADGGARIDARLVRRARVLAAIAGLTFLGLFESYGFAALASGAVVATNHRKRQAAKLRMLRLVIEPLLPHQRGAARGPFR